MIKILNRIAYRFTSSLFAAALPDLRVVDTDSVANKALVAVIAIMTFMSALAIAAASMIHNASRDWSASISHEMTIQIKPVVGRNMINDLNRATDIASKFSGIEKVTALSKSESEELLRPWLGADFELSDLPIPHLITARISRTEVVDIKALSDALRIELPNVVVDDHRIWRERLRTMSNGMIAVSSFAILLFAIAIGLAVSFATRGAMAGSKEIVEVLHFVGASDKFIAREFQRRFLKVGMLGATVGCGFALILIWSLELVLQSLSASNIEQVETLFGRIEIQSGMFLIMIFTTLLMGGITSVISRMVASNLLKDRIQR